MKEKSCDRNILYDAIKGVGILLVVMGHVIQGSVNDFDSNIFFRFIYSFHMPLFMYISGVIVPLGRKIDLCWLKRKFSQLVIPFVVWIFVPFLLAETKDWDGLYLQIINVIKSPDYGYWFLWILFLNCVCLYINVITCEIFKIKREYFIILVEILFLFLIGKIIPYLGLSMLAYHSVYYFAGYLLSKYSVVENIKNRKILVCISVLTWMFFASMWFRTQPPDFVHLLQTWIPKSFVSIIDLGYDYIVGFSGILAVCGCIKYLIMKSSIASALTLLGKYTLEIYVLHFYFIGMFACDNTVIGILVNFILGLFFSIVVADCIESGKASKLLFGKDMNKS